MEWVAREGKRTESFHGGAKGGVFKYQQNECSMGHDLFDMLPTDCRRSQLLVRSGVKKKLAEKAFRCGPAAGYLT